MVLLKGRKSHLLRLSNDLHRSWCSIIVFWDLSKLPIEFFYFCYEILTNGWSCRHTSTLSMMKSCFLNFIFALGDKLFFKKPKSQLLKISPQGVLSLEAFEIGCKACLFLPSVLERGERERHKDAVPACSSHTATPGLCTMGYNSTSTGLGIARVFLAPPLSSWSDSVR